MQTTVKAIALSTLLFSATVSLGEVVQPFSMSYAGRLTGADGKPVVGPIVIDVSFYPTQDSTTAIVTTPQHFTDISPVDGMLQLPLTLTPVDFHAVFGGTLNTWIEIKDSTNNRTYPRQRFGAVPYALKVPIDPTTLEYDNNGLLRVKAIPASVPVAQADDADHATTADTAGSFTGVLGGDVTGAQGSTTVGKIRGKNLSFSPDGTNDGRFLRWNNGSDRFELATAFSGNLGGDVTGAQGATVVSKLQGADLDFAGANVPDADDFLKFDGTKWVPAPVTGASGGTVTSVAAGAGLTTGAGAITASGTVAVATGGITNTMVASGIDAVKIGAGDVDNTKLSYLNSATSNIQTQLNAKSASGHVHAAGDITSGQLNVAQGGTGTNLALAPGGIVKQAVAGGALSVSALALGDIPAGVALTANNLSDLANATTARSNLGAQASDADLTSVAALGSTGIAVRTAADTWAQRTLTAGSSKITIADGNGVGGNPTVDIDEASLTLTSIGGTLSVAKGGTGTASVGSANLVFASPTGAGGPPSFRALVAADISAVESDPKMQTLSVAEVDQLENIGATAISAAQWGYLGGMGSAPVTTETDPKMLTLTSAEVNQLENIGTTTISAAKWGYLGAMTAQPLQSETDPKMLTLTSTEVNQLENIDATAISATQWGYLGAMSSQPAYGGVNTTITSLTGISNGGTIGVPGAEWTFDDTNNEITTTARIGIGTVNPSRALHITGPASAAPEMTFETSDGLANNKKWNLYVTGAAAAAQNLNLRILNDADNATTLSAMTWLANGNVGIGTTTPVSLLTLKSSSINSQAAGLKLVGNTSANAIVSIFENGTDGGAMYLRDGATNSVLISANTHSYFNGGNVGIGTTAPSTLLTAAGAGTETTQFLAGRTIGVKNTTANASIVANQQIGSLAFLNDTGTAVAGVSAHYSTAANGSNSYLSFKTGNTADRMTITTGGNVGIGSATPAVKLDVAGQIRAQVYNAGASTSIDWANGNVQYSSATCTALTFSNMLEGGSYSLIMTSGTVGTCTFSQTVPDTLAAGVFKFSPANGPTTTTKQTVYSFLRAGNNVYVSWIPGF